MIWSRSMENKIKIMRGRKTKIERTDGTIFMNLYRS